MNKCIDSIIEAEEERKRVSAEKGRIEMDRMKQVEEEEKRKQAEEARLAKEKADQERMEKQQFVYIYIQLHLPLCALFNG